MDKCYSVHFMSMSGPGPVEKRPVVMLRQTFSCSFERIMHEMNSWLLLRKRLGIV